VLEALCPNGVLSCTSGPSEGGAVLDERVVRPPEDPRTVSLSNLLLLAEVFASKALCRFVVLTTSRFAFGVDGAGIRGVSGDPTE
jgi:hypothetical protein